LEVEREVRNLKQQAERFMQAIAGGGGDIPSIVQRLKQIEKLIAAAEAQAVSQRAKSETQIFPADRKGFLRDPLPTLMELARTSCGFAELLRQIITEVVVVPVQDLLHGQVRPRIKVRCEFANTTETAGAPSPVSWNGTFDAFELPKYLSLLEQVKALKAQQPKAGAKKLAAILGSDKMTVSRALRYLKLMEERGLTDPYVELKERPAKASRWRHRGD
jgi:hypothetical protein